ncbi:hypothetical protein [Marimonas lutisalis]|uniref:hypothetical protein n=1 Tax=Marimonas lutisalis TaxID=2545756 RepID=UPI0010F7BB44|nr:hypothetical protein [Marimonas lutisalis]
MADITSQFTFSDEGRSGFRRVLASIARGMTAYTEACSRRDQIAALEAKSDEELAAMGIKRDDIARHVFRDLFYT